MEGVPIRKGSTTKRLVAVVVSLEILRSTPPIFSVQSCRKSEKFHAMMMNFLIQFDGAYDPVKNITPEPIQSRTPKHTIFT